MGNQYIYEDEEGNQYVYEDEEQSSSLDKQNASISAPKTSILGSLGNLLFGKSDYADGYTEDKKGNLVFDVYNPETKKIESLPESQQHASDRKVAQAASLASTFLPFGILAKAPLAETAFGRVMTNYLPTAAASSAFGIGADKFGQEQGLLPQTSDKEDINRMVTETAIGGSLPYGLEQASNVINWITGKFTNPQRTARLFGATPSEMNPEKPFPVQDSIEYLSKNSPTFREGVLSTGNLDNGYSNIKEQLNRTGTNLQDLYSKSGDITASIQDIENHPAIQKLFNDATSNATVPGVSNAASKAYEDIMGRVGSLAQKNNGNIKIQDLWELKKSIDDIANLNSLSPSLSDEYLSDARIAIKDAINTAIDRTNPEQGQLLKSLNNEYHHLANVKNSIARGVSKYGGQLPLVDDKTPMSLAGTLGRITGLGTNTARAGMFKAGEAASAAKQLAGQLGIGGLQTFQRTSPIPIPNTAIPNALNNFLSPSEAQGQELGFMPQQNQSLPLPRDTERFNSDAIMEFLMRASQTPQAPIAQELVKKLQQAFQAQDMDTAEKIHSDMARLFPDMFEQGLGVNGKIFYPDEQAKYMDKLKQLNRMGVIDSIHLAKQRNAFNNSQDSRVLPVVPQQPKLLKTNSTFYNGSRIYDY